ncbi:phage holin [Shouchella clausii]|uniref:phage holin n=1 Tax=Shouchella clausii TaxID=79880 RepID=UPI000BA4F528|nr:phage holin [Shouchella clausii]PAD19110.1 hypothetical protein CHH73_03340 [Shouchella clausii]
MGLPEGLALDIQNPVEPVLYVLVLLGIIVDPTTDGVVDSEQAQEYVEPRRKTE